jgi:hypothetical protein
MNLEVHPRIEPLIQTAIVPFERIVSNTNYFTIIFISQYQIFLSHFLIVRKFTNL